MKKLIILIVIISIKLFAQGDTVLAKADSIVVADLHLQIQQLIKYQDELRNEYEKVETIKAYLITRKTFIEKKRKDGYN